MASIRKLRDSKGRFVKKGSAKPAAGKRKYRRRGNDPDPKPRKYRRRRNPSGFTANQLLGHGAAFLAGAVVGGASGVLDKILDPALTASPWKRPWFDLGAGALAGVVCAAAGAPSLAHGAIGAGAGLTTLRIVDGLGAPEDRIARAQAVVTHEQARAAAASNGGKGAALYRRRITPALPAVQARAALPAAAAVQAAAAQQPAMAGRAVW